MAVSHQGVYLQTPGLGALQILPGATSTKQTLYTAGANGSKITSVNCASTDTSVRIVQLWVTRSAVDYLLNSVSVTALAGNDGTVAPLSLFAGYTGLPVDNDGQRYLLLQSGDVLKSNTTTTVTAAKEVDVTCVAGDF